jgi:hypothetical protein
VGGIVRFGHALAARFLSAGIGFIVGGSEFMLR